MRPKKSNLLCLSLFAVFSCIGCDGYIWVEGRAYRPTEKIDGIQSNIYLDDLEELLPAGGLTPLDNVKVTIFHGGDYSKEALDERTIWKNIEITNSEGKFAGGSTTAPKKEKYIIRAEKPGYVTVQKLFAHPRKNHKKHFGIIILKPNDIESK